MGIFLRTTVDHVRNSRGAEEVEAAATAYLLDKARRHPGAKCETYVRAAEAELNRAVDASHVPRIYRARVDVLSRDDARPLPRFSGVALAMTAKVVRGSKRDDHCLRALTQSFEMQVGSHTSKRDRYLRRLEAWQAGLAVRLGTSDWRVCRDAYRAVVARMDTILARNSQARESRARSSRVVGVGGGGTGAGGGCGGL